MADCPGVLHLANMADGGLARLRVPGGALTAAELVAVADAAERFGAGVIDLTNRANLQIRGVAEGAGPVLAEALAAAGFRILGEADRRRNILVDPFSGADPSEVRDMRPLAKTLEARLVEQPWIARLSPKFSFVLDGSGESCVSAVPSDVAALGDRDGVLVAAAGLACIAPDDYAAVRIMVAIAAAAAGQGEAARAADLDASHLRDALLSAEGAALVPSPPKKRLAPRLGAVPSVANRFAVALPVPVGRLDPTMLRFVAEAAETLGDGVVRLAPWSAIVIAGVVEETCDPLLARSEQAGFAPVTVAERLSVVACAGAPACERAREPAKNLAREVLRLAAARPDLLPPGRSTLHLSACPKGCAGSTAADLLLLGASDRSGWSAHRRAAPRAPGPSFGRLDTPSPAAILALLAR